jgi:hypothetical protein
MQKKQSFVSAGICHLLLTGRGPIFVQERTTGGMSAAHVHRSDSVRFVRFPVEMFHQQPAIVCSHLVVVSLRDGIRCSLCATFEHLGFLAEDRKVRHHYLLLVAAEGSHDVRNYIR